MNILFIGDIVGSPGRQAVASLLPGLIKEYALDFAIANAENAAGGSGITPRVAQELFAAGLDVLTSGDHIWKKREVFEIINQEERILRPLNFPVNVPGRGCGLFKKKGKTLGVINLQGRVFMEPLECPFRAARQAQEELAKETKGNPLRYPRRGNLRKDSLGLVFRRPGFGNPGHAYTHPNCR